jgi:hypothetical protein
VKRVTFVLCLSSMIYADSALACGSNCGSQHTTNNTDVQNIYQETVVKKHSDLGRGLFWGAIGTCGAISVYHRISDGSWRWCWQDKQVIHFTGQDTTIEFKGGRE